MKLILTPSETAEALQTSLNAVYQMLEAGEIPAYRQGRNWKIPRKALETWIVEKAMAEAEERKKNGK